MNADPKLIELARQLGTVIKAYAGDSLRDGHALLEIASAFQDGATEAVPGHEFDTYVDLPMKLSESIGDHSPDDPFDLNAIGAIRLKVFSDQVRAERITRQSKDWPYDLNYPNTSVRLDGHAHLVTEVVGRADNSFQIRPLYNDRQPIGKRP